MSVLKNIDNTILELNKSLNWSYYARAFVLEHLATFDQLPDATCFGTYIDFNSLPHDQVMEVVKAFPGRWKKEPDGNGKIHYSITLRNSSKVTELIEIVIRCYSGEPPPNCKVIYEDVLVPARTERRAKMICIDRGELNGSNGHNRLPDAIAEIVPESEEIPF